MPRRPSRRETEGPWPGSCDTIGTCPLRSRPADHDSVLESYVEGLPPDRAALSRELDGAIGKAHAGLDVAIKYGILMYALGGDWRHWVVAIDAKPARGVGLKFLYGVMMSDDRHVLRAGTSVLMSWDFSSAAVFDHAAVETYVDEAVRLYPKYKADEQAILAAARTSASSRGRSSPNGGM